MEQLAQDIVNAQNRVRRSFRRKQKTDKILMTMYFIFQDTTRENERETGDRITGEIFSMSELFHEDATQEGGNNYGKDPLYYYKATSD